MKAILLTHYGDPDILKIVERPDPFPEAGQVRVKISAIGLNYAEVLSRKGQYGWAPRLPYIPGMEAFGVIDMLGAGVKDKKIGQAVIVGDKFGSYAEYMVVDARQVRAAIRSFSPEENAAFAVTYLTAWAALFEQARVRKGDVVLVHAAAGGVGSSAVQLLKHAGCHVIGAVGSDDKLQTLIKLGVDFAVNYNTPGWDKLIRQKYPAGVNVALCLVAGDVFKKTVGLMAPLGKVSMVGIAGLEYNTLNPVKLLKALSMVPRLDVRQMFTRSYGVMAMHLGYLMANTELVAGLWEDLTIFVRKHKIRPVIGAVFPFEHMPQAHRLMQSRGSTGKIIVKVN